jgi:hypothetical protein
MNRLLIGILDIVNKLIAISIIVSSTVEGYFGDFSAYVGPTYLPYRILWAVVGFVIGLVLAGIVSGLLAAIITIAREMAALREMVSVRVWTTPPPR